MDITFYKLQKFTFIYLFGLFVIDFIWRIQSLKNYLSIIGIIKSFSATVVFLFFASIVLAAIIKSLEIVLGVIFKGKNIYDIYYNIVAYLFVAYFGAFYAILTFFWIRSFRMISGDIFRIIAILIIVVFLAAAFLFNKKKMLEIFYAKMPEKYSGFRVLIIGSFIVLFVVLVNMMIKMERSGKSETIIPTHSAKTLFKRPNIVIVTIDSLAASHMSLYGYARRTTPFIEEFAKESFIFDKMHSNSEWTGSSLPTISSSLYPWTHRIFREQYRYEIKSKDIRSILKNHGYQIIDPVPIIGMGKKGFSFSLFDKYYETIFGIKTWLGNLEQMYLSQIIRSFRIIFNVPKVEDSDDQSIEIMENAVLRSGRPFFVWVHFMAPHEFNIAVPPKPFYGEFSKGKRDKFENYDDLVLYADALFMRVIGLLKDKSLYGSTMVILTADHGPHLHRNYLSEDHLHIPLVIHFPGQQRSIRVPTLAAHTDIAPTILEMLKIKIPDWMEGEPLAQYLPSGKSKKAKFAMNFRAAMNDRRLLAQKSGAVAAYWEDYKLLFNLEDNSVLLYNLSKDPEGKVNIIDDNHEIAAYLKGLIINKLKQADSEIKE